jgi:hypothetical protein
MRSLTASKPLPQTSGSQMPRAPTRTPPVIARAARGSRVARMRSSQKVIVRRKAQPASAARTPSTKIGIASQGLPTVSGGTL